MFYSPSTKGFYHPGIHRQSIPEDAVSIHDDEYEALLSGQEHGLQIMMDAAGRPALVEPSPTPVSEESARRERDQRLASSDWSVLPDAKLTSAQKSAWKIYRQALRDVPEQEGFPGSILWPDLPA